MFITLKTRKRSQINEKFVIAVAVEIVLFVLIMTSSLCQYAANIEFKKVEFKEKIGKGNGRIFDTWMYNNEGNVAYVRLWRLYDYVDRFFIIVSNLTHSGKKKELSFAPFEEEIKPFMDKVDIVWVEPNICDRKNYPKDTLNWCTERTQRDYAKDYIEQHYNPTENDIILISDADEIFTKNAMKYIINNPPEDFIRFKGSMYFPYYFHKVEDWDFAVAVRYRHNMTTLSNVRGNSGSKKAVTDKGKAMVTHCSYCFDSIEMYKTKLVSFVHTEFGKPPYTTNDWIFKSHYCRKKINSPAGYDEEDTDWSELIPNNPKLRFLYDPSFMYNISQTSYKTKDLEHLCSRKYRRTPFNQ